MIRLPQPGRTLVMGILNVTADSFSDGGEYLNVEAAVAHGQQLAADGADLVDVGGESTRPGAQRVPAEVEAARVLPVIQRLSASGVPVSVDTMRAEVAAAAVAAGAVLVNDVSGGLADPQMLAAVADAEVPYLAMHWRGPSDQMQQLAHYDDVVAEVSAELAERVAAALAAGVRRERLVIDPGLGFAKTAEHNWALLNNLDALRRLGLPLLIGASRKRFLGELLADADGPRPSKQRDDATIAVTTLLAAAGVWGVRTHQVRAQRDAIAVAGRLTSLTSPPPACRTVVGSRRRGISPMEKLDRITLRGIEAVARHGVYPQEKVNPQPFAVDLTVWLEPRPASDELATTVDYSELVALAAGVLNGESVDLIETLAERIAQGCLARPGVAEVEVTVHKPDAPLAVPIADAAVTINRRKP